MHLTIHRFRTFAFYLIVGLSVATGFGCVPNSRIMNSAAEQSEAKPLATPVPPSFEGDVEAMRTADFDFIYVFRRKDGGLMDGDDRVFVNENTPLETNRRKISDEGKAIILGSNFKFPPEVMQKLSDRFAFTDYSKAGNPGAAANASAPAADR
ncbi:hypothetical protein BH24ACI3_BH24ACI3_12050 [soil metagenome]